MLSYALSNLRANLTRLIATATAVIIGIAFLAAGLMLTDAMQDALDGSTARQYAGVDLVVRSAATAGGQSAVTVPDDVLDTVRSTSGVTAAAGELSGSAALLDRNDDSLTPRATGRAWIDARQLNPLRITQGRAPDADGEVVLDAGTASDLDLRVGSSVRLSTPAGVDAAKVVGISRFGDQDAIDDGGTISLAPATAQSLLGAGTSGWDDVLIATRSPAAVEGRLTSTLPRSLEVVTGAKFREDQQSLSSGLVDLLRPVLQGFAYLAMFVAGFVIFNTFSVVVTQRFQELALIRAVGGTPGQVRRSLLFEGLVIGFVSSAIGIAAGAGLALALQAALSAFGVTLPGSGVAIRPTTIVLSLLVGTIVTVVSVAVPAFRAGRTKPVEAMRSAAIDRSGTSKARGVIGGAFLVLGLVLLLVDRLGSASALLLFPGALFLFIGVIVGGPLIARVFAMLLRPVARRFGMTTRLAVDNTARNPKRTATTANALVIGLFLVTLVTVSGDALKTWTVTQLDKLSSSDYIVATRRGGLDSSLVDRIGSTKGVTAVGAVRQSLVLNTAGQYVLLSGADVRELSRATGLAVNAGSLTGVEDGSGSAVADLPSGGGGGGGPGSDREAAPRPTRVGETDELVGADGTPTQLPVAALLEPKLDTLLLGTLVSPERFSAIAGDQPITQVYVRADTKQTAEVGRRLDRLVKTYAGVKVQPGNFIGDIVAQVFDFLIGTVNALLGMSVVIALVGIVNTLTLSIIERRRELGMVRALGMTRQQVGRMVRIESLLIGVLGTVIGVGAGLLVGWVVIGSLSSDIPLAVNWARLGLIALAGVLVGAIASLLPARRATRVEMIEAMATT